MIAKRESDLHDPMSTPLNILVVYRNRESALRPTTLEHLRSFRRYTEHRCDYVNVEYATLPSRGALERYDLVILHYLCHANRWSGPAAFERSMEPLSSLATARVRVALLAQDEFIHTDLMEWMIDRFGVRTVFSVAPPHEWQTIYRTDKRRDLQVHQVLTGYIDDETVRRIEQLGANRPTADIDLGYRTAGRPYAWFGRHGMLKEDIAIAFSRAGAAAGLRCDISTEQRDTILGDDWYRFLMRCRWTFGVESGTSIIDRDGSIRRRTEEFTSKHPAATFPEIEAQCFPGIDGTARLFAISPRHLEACITGTAQVLTEGDYNGVLRPGDHYLPLRKDFSNLTQVVDVLADDRVRQGLIDRTWNDIVTSGTYSYRAFVNQVITASMSSAPPVPRVSASQRWDSALSHWKSLARMQRSRVARTLGLRPPVPNLEI